MLSPIVATLACIRVKSLKTKLARLYLFASFINVASKRLITDSSDIYKPARPCRCPIQSRMQLITILVAIFCCWSPVKFLLTNKWPIAVVRTLILIAGLRRLCQHDFRHNSHAKASSIMPV